MIREEDILRVLDLGAEVRDVRVVTVGGPTGREVHKIQLQHYDYERASLDGKWRAPDGVKDWRRAAQVLAEAAVGLMVSVEQMQDERAQQRKGGYSMYIHMTVFSGNLIGSTTGVDEMASAHKYRDLLQEALLERWPQAVVEIRVQQAEGVTAPTRVYLGDEEALDLEEDVDTIAADVWARGEWAVKEQT